MPIYTWRQNNSYGAWALPAETIIVEADDVYAAQDIAGQHGVRFESRDDCECCGYRWHLEPNGEHDMPLDSVVKEFTSGKWPKHEKTWRGEDLPHYKVLERKGDTTMTREEKLFTLKDITHIIEDMLDIEWPDAERTFARIHKFQEGARTGRINGQDVPKWEPCWHCKSILPALLRIGEK